MSSNGDRARIVGQGIRVKRTERGLSQKALGALLGIEQRQISDWERGVHEPTLANLERLAEALECHWTEFYVAGRAELEEKVA